MTQPRPCLPAEAVRRALSVVGQGIYSLGQGGYDPLVPTKPWTGAGESCDCSGFASWAYKLPRDRPGFNHGAWSSVSDAINTDSLVEDGEHRNELFVVVGVPAAGDLLCFPGIRIPGQSKRVRIGHVSIVTAVGAAEWNTHDPDYRLLTVAQCFPRRPAIQETDGRLWNARQMFKGQTNAAWRTRILRAVP